MTSIWNKHWAFFTKMNASNRTLDYITNLFYLYTIVPYVTACFVKLKWTPNVATILSGICGSLAGYFIYSGNYLVAGTLIVIHQTLDIVDGNLARLTKKSSPLGAKLDLHFDRVVRTSLLLGVLFGTELDLIFKVLFVVTIFLDIIIVHKYVLPFASKTPLIRSKWKKWFVDRGMIPAFDIFTMYFLLSILCFIGNIEIFVLICIVGKNVDWIYRIWECVNTKRILEKN